MNLWKCLILLNVCHLCWTLPCGEHKTCGQCISNALERCKWCPQEGNSTQSRCQPEYSTTTCATGFINPTTKKHDDDTEFSDTVQFKPKKIEIKARPGVKVDIEMFYKPAKNYPVDVYFLVDNSQTMQKYKETLRREIQQIYRTLKTITDNVQLGLGSFVEKPGLPYADTSIHTVYTYRNHLKMSTDMNAFQAALDNLRSKYGSNYESQEAGLDALMQVMTCTDQLEWRNESRKMIVFATDAPYHSCGDGKMVGAININDMNCHLENEEYKPEYSLNFDYPSVSQINAVAKNRKYLIIFAAFKRVQYEYETLANEIVGARYVELKTDSNIAQIIESEYKNSAYKVPLVVNNPNKNLIIDVDQDCEHKKNCESTYDKPEVKIPASISSSECSSEVLKLSVNPVGLNDTLHIEFTVDCTCDCENTNAPISPDCNSEGSKQCGVCKCNKDRSGDFCENKCSDFVAWDTSKCKKDPSEKLPCNGRGKCECGLCKCDIGENGAIYSGQFCEYDSTKCPKWNNVICGGEERGSCEKQECICKPSWTKADCSCSTSNNSCIEPISRKVCSGRGSCDCGSCKCEESVTGAFCDFCEHCVQDRCDILKEYANCNRENAKADCDEKFKPLLANKVILVDKTEFDAHASATKCRKELDDGKIVVFKYEVVKKRTKGELTVIIQNELELPPAANIWVVIGSTLGTVILVGLLSLIAWKVLIDIYDKREYDRFCQEAESQGFVVSNPVYNSPVTHINNPML